MNHGSRISDELEKYFGHFSSVTSNSVICLAQYQLTKRHCVIMLQE